MRWSFLWHRAVCRPMRMGFFLLVDFSSTTLLAMDSVDTLLAGIAASLAAAESAVGQTQVSETPDLVSALLAKNGASKLEGVSLLALKNSALLAYINHLVLVVVAHMERLQDEDGEKAKKKAVEASILHRTTLEKGVKPLEKKLSYQLDKMVRAYNRMAAEGDRVEDEVRENGAGSGSDSDEEDDALSYKPDARALAKMTKSTEKPGSREAPSGTYKPPKISAVAPPVAASRESVPKGSSRKLQSMEEYLQEQSDLPQVENSIGSQIVDHGRGGVKTSRDRQKEMEIQRYEEGNFTRLPSTATKKSFREKQQERANTFAGEDWSIFNNKRTMEGTSRKRGASAWDKVKRRKQ